MLARVTSWIRSEFVSQTVRTYTEAATPPVAHLRADRDARRCGPAREDVEAFLIRTRRLLLFEADDLDAALDLAARIPQPEWAAPSRSAPSRSGRHTTSTASTMVRSPERSILWLADAAGCRPYSRCRF